VLLDDWPALTEGLLYDDTEIRGIIDGSYSLGNTAVSLANVAQGTANNALSAAATKQPIITATGENNLLIAPKEVGGQPGTVEISDFATSDQMIVVGGLLDGLGASVSTKQPKITSVGDRHLLVCPDQIGGQPGSKAISDFVLHSELDAITDDQLTAAVDEIMAAIEDLPNSVLTDYALKSDYTDVVRTTMSNSFTDVGDDTTISTMSYDITDVNKPNLMIVKANPTSMNTMTLSQNRLEFDAPLSTEPELVLRSNMGLWDVHTKDLVANTVTILDSSTGDATDVKASIATKQDKITATGATNLLLAPSSSGGQPGVKAVSDFQAKITATGTGNFLTAPSAAGGQPGVKAITDMATMDYVDNKTTVPMVISQPATTPPADHATFQNTGNGTFMINWRDNSNRLRYLCFNLAGILSTRLSNDAGTTWQDAEFYLKSPAGALTEQNLLVQPQGLGGVPRLKPFTDFVLKPARSETWLNPMIVNSNITITPTLPLASYNFISFVLNKDWANLDVKMLNLSAFTNSSAPGVITLTGVSGYTTYTLAVTYKSSTTTTITLGTTNMRDGTTICTNDGDGLRCVIFT
jgi:hypothetical protein